MMTRGKELSLEQQVVMEALQGVIDPEIGRSVVDVGLIYDIHPGEGRMLGITMTTTTRGCPATQFLMDAVRQRALGLGEYDGVEVRLTYEPPWSPGMMAE